MTLGASSIVTEELAPIVGGLAVSQGELGFKRLVIAITLGGWIATVLLYALGRWRRRWLLRRFPRAGPAIKRTLRAVRRRPWRSALLVRFAFGARLLLPLACGVAHVRPDIYLIGTAVSSIAWSTLFVFVGYEFGDAAMHALGRVRAYDQYVVGVLVGLLVLAWLIWRARRRRLREAARAAARADARPSPTAPRGSSSA